MRLRELTEDERRELRRLQAEMEGAIDADLQADISRQMSSILRAAEERAAVDRLRPRHIQRGYSRIPIGGMADGKRDRRVIR